MDLELGPVCWLTYYKDAFRDSVKTAFLERKREGEKENI
jgi:hypothetical protein